MGPDGSKGSKWVQRVQLGPKDPGYLWTTPRLHAGCMQATSRLHPGCIQASIGICQITMPDIFGQLEVEDNLGTTLAQDLDPLDKELKQTRDILYDLRNIFLSGQYQKRHHVYHKRAQGRQHSREVRNCCRSGLHSCSFLQIQIQIKIEIQIQIRVEI